MELDERIRKAEPQLRNSGVTYSLIYLGYVPVKEPVHQMGRTVRETLINHVLLTMYSKKKGNTLPIPPLDEATAMVIGEPKFMDIHVTLTINAKTITVVYDEKEKEPYAAKEGNLMRQHPVKLTSIVDSIGEYDCFAYISKKESAKADRRCCVFMTSPGTTTAVVNTLEEAIAISSQDDSSRATPTLPPCQHTRMTSSGSATPTPRTNSSSSLNDGPRYADLHKHKWYHGVISRDVAIELLKQPGDFLIRESKKNVNQLILSAICEQGKDRHLELFSKDGSLRVKELAFTSVDNLISHFMTTQDPIRSLNVSYTMYLRNPIYRE